MPSAPGWEKLDFADLLNRFNRRVPVLKNEVSKIDAIVIRKWREIEQLRKERPDNYLPTILEKGKLQYIKGLLNKKMGFVDEVHGMATRLLKTHRESLNEARIESIKRAVSDFNKHFAEGREQVAKANRAILIAFGREIDHRARLIALRKRQHKSKAK